MNPRSRLYRLLAVLTLAAFAIACGETGKANKLIDEGNASVEEAKKLAAQADTKINQLDDGLANFPEGREQLAGTSQEAIDLLDKGIAKLREAEKKFADGSKTDIDAPLKEYLSVKSQEFGKHAEHLEALKDIPKSITDTSIEDRDALGTKFAEIRERVEKLEKEWTDLAARADKIYEENKAKFKS